MKDLALNLTRLFTYYAGVNNQPRKKDWIFPENRQTQNESRIFFLKIESDFFPGGVCPGTFAPALVPGQRDTAHCFLEGVKVAPRFSHQFFCQTGRLHFTFKTCQIVAGISKTCQFHEF